MNYLKSNPTFFFLLLLHQPLSIGCFPWHVHRIIHVRPGPTVSLVLILLNVDSAATLDASPTAFESVLGSFAFTLCPPIPWHPQLCLVLRLEHFLPLIYVMT